MTSVTPPSHIARNALRRALRDHPGSAAILDGRRVNDLPLDVLRTHLISLGLDPAAIAAAALSGIAPAPIAPPCDIPPQDAPTSCEAPMPDDYLTGAAGDAIESELSSIRGLIGTGGFAALDSKLRQLVTDSRKPPVTVEIVREIEIPVAAGAARPVHRAKPTGSTGTWKQLFQVKGRLGSRSTALWDSSHPDTPKVIPDYVWPHPATETVLTQIARGRNAYLFGPAGTGKTAFAEQLAARTGRPFVLISCDAGTDAATLVGMTAPAADGGVTWQDGQLTRAIRTPGAVVCIDEPSVARPGALMVLQNVLANRSLFIAETGERVPVASGVLFLATDNTNGTGGGSRRGYTDTHRLNTAFLDRFGGRVKIDYLPADAEAKLLVSRTGCTLALAKLLIAAATVTRAAADNQSLSHGIGLRRLLAWAEMLTDGINAAAAFDAAVLNAAPEQDIETLREQCLLAYDQAQVTRALADTDTRTDTRTGTGTDTDHTDPADSNPTYAGRRAAQDFR